MNSPGSEGAAGSPPRRRGRLVALAVAGAVGIGTVAWTVGQYLSSPGAVPASSADPSGPPEESAGPPVAVTPGMLSVHVAVRVRGGDGEDVAVGTSIPTPVALQISGEDGRQYEARFDRVGVWLMEVPPGVYLAPLEQPELKNWKWKLTGRNVTSGPEGPVLRFESGGVPPRLELLLHE